MNFILKIKKEFHIGISFNKKMNYYLLSSDDYSIYKNNQKIDNRLDLKNHSPLGLTWGYSGSGPSQSALAILSDYVNESYAKAYYEKFRNEVISNLTPHKNHKLKYKTIQSWIENN